MKNNRSRGKGFAFLMMFGLGVIHHHSFASLPSGTYPEGYYRLPDTHNSCVSQVSSQIHAGPLHVIGVNYSPGHETCDLNYVYLSQDHGLHFEKSRPLGNDGCAHVSQIRFCHQQLYVELMNWGGSQAIYRSFDLGAHFAEVSNTDTGWLACSSGQP